MAAKYLQLAAELRRQCVRMQRQGQTKLPGEMSLCEQTGYSRQTVRRALDLLEKEGLIVRLHGSGTYLAGVRSAKKVRVAVIVSSAETYLYPQLLRDVESVCAPAGYTVDVYATENLVSRERAVLTRLLADPPAGILMEGAMSALPSPNLDLLAQIGRRGIPLVWLHAPHPQPENAPCFQDDNEGGSRLLVRHLRDRGHERIAAVFKSDDRQGHERYLGYVSELLRTGCEIHEENILWYSTEDKAALLEGDTAWLRHFIRSHLRPCTAVVCYNDEIAYPLIRCLLKAQIRVPEDVAVVSFDNSHLCSLSPVPISSLGHERHQMGSSAARALLRLIQGKKGYGARLTWTLRERRSG
jgi:Transcriptional regulators